MGRQIDPVPAAGDPYRRCAEIRSNKYRALHGHTGEGSLNEFPQRLSALVKQSQLWPNSSGWTTSLGVWEQMANAWLTRQDNRHTLGHILIIGARSLVITHDAALGLNGSRQIAAQCDATSGPTDMPA